MISIATKSPPVTNWDILAEDWGQIVVLEDITVRIRPVLTHVEYGKDNSFEFRSAVQVEAIAPKSRSGAPGEGKFHEENVVKRIEEFKTIKHAESIYRLPDDRLLILKYRPQVISLTDKFNKHGEPVLGVKAQTDAILMDAPSRAKKGTIKN